MNEGRGGLITGMIGLAMLAGAGTAYWLSQTFGPPRVIHAPAPAPVPVPSAVPTSSPAFGPVPHVTVISVPPPNPAPVPTAAPTPAPVAVEKHIAKPAHPIKKRITRKTKSQRQLESRWHVKR